MKNIERDIISALCNNNVQKAKEYTKIFLEQNKTKSDEAFCKRMLNVLTSRGNNLIELPANVSRFLIMEDVSISFNENRYFLTDREKNVFDEILKMNSVAEKMSEMQIRYVNSTMLHGESGTGKTTFGRYIAYKLGLPFTYLNLSMTVDSHLGDTQKNITRAFDYIKSQKCVFMLDEIDAIGMKRGNNNDVTEISRVVISLMQNIDTLSNDVILIGGTNRIDVLDEALLRRFFIKHEVQKPTQEEIKCIANKFLADVNYSFIEKEIDDIVSKSKTQSETINNVISLIAQKIYQCDQQ